MFFYVKILLGDFMYFEYNNNSYEVVIERKNNKNLYIRVKEDLKIYITCNYFTSNFEIKKLLKNNEKDIIKLIEKQNKNISKKEETKNYLLGNEINIVYCNIFKKPKFEDNRLFIKDDKAKEKWYLEYAKDIFQERLDYIYSLFKEKIPYPKLKIRTMKTRWGVCNRKDNSVTLNLELIKKDIKYLDYVIVHELSHFVHFDHSKNFWLEVCKYSPNYKELRKGLRSYDN